MGPAWGANNFRDAIERTLIHEGGYSNHPNDPGGPTNFGITLADVRKYLDPQASAGTVRALTKAQAVTIYKAHYWDTMRGDELPAGLDYCVVDYAVNAGVGRAGRHLRRVLELPEDNWRVTDEVIAGTKAQHTEDLIHDLSDERMSFQMGLGRSFNVFKKGWKRRIDSAESAAIHMYRLSQGLEKGNVDDDLSSIPRRGPGKAYFGEPEQDA